MEREITTQKLMSIMDYAKYKQVTRQTVYNWIKDKEIMTYKLGGKQFIIID